MPSTSAPSMVASTKEDPSRNGGECKSHAPPPTVDAILKDVYAFERELLGSATNDNHATAFLNPHYFRLQSSNMSYLNHGGFGDPHPSTLKLRQYYTDLCYQISPMVYHRSLVPALVTRARERACDFLGICGEHKKGFAFTSISSALFTVLDSVVHFDAAPNDEANKRSSAVVVLDTIYHSVGDALLHLSQTKGFAILTVETPHGANMDDIYKEFERVVSSASRRGDLTIKLAVFDHISSKPTIMYPVKKMCSLCRSLRIPTLVDGAHVPGGIPFFHSMGVPDIGPTFYCVTFHKWCNTPRGGNSGGIWVNLQDVDAHYNGFVDISRIVVHGGWAEEEANTKELYLDATKPGYLTDDLTQGIYDESTREYENIMVLPHCIDLVNHHQAAFERHKKELREATIDILQQAWNLSYKEATCWGTGAVNVATDEADRSIKRFVLPMLCIPLPMSKLLQATETRFRQDAKEYVVKRHVAWLKKQLVLQLWNEYAVEVPIFVWKEKGLGVRISFGRHVVVQDIHRLADSVNDIVAKDIQEE